MGFQATLTSAAGNAPLAVGLGNGVGAPAMFLIAGVILTLFAVPFAAMSRRITNAGAFYSYVTAGISRPAGVAAGWVAQCTYNVVLLVPLAYAGYFGSYIFEAEFGVTVPWPVFTFAVLLFVWLVGLRGIELNTLVLGIFLLLEVAILLATIIGIAMGPGLTVEAVKPENVFDGNFGGRTGFSSKA
ncbi:hypothetical protein [Arthrobacter globiformis]|uniref:hypothetical protein n=1 Tax=Arthrobacter globiformis TaxID=1665 RepID=UPI0035947F8D